MAYFEPRIYRAVNAVPLMFDIMKFAVAGKVIISLYLLMIDHWWRLGADFGGTEIFE